MLRQRLRDVFLGLSAGAAVTLIVERSLSPGPAPPPAADSAAPTAQPVGATGRKGEGQIDPSARHIVQHGLPLGDNVSSYTGYVASVNHRTRIPDWVAEHLTRDGEAAAATSGADRKHSRFKSAAELPPMWRATNEDYRGSGFSRGHLAPAGAHRGSQQELDETFLLSSNIVPQV